MTSPKSPAPGSAAAPSPRADEEPSPAPVVVPRRRIYEPPPPPVRKHGGGHGYGGPGKSHPRGDRAPAGVASGGGVERPAGAGASPAVGGPPVGGRAFVPRAKWQKKKKFQRRQVPLPVTPRNLAAEIITRVERDAAYAAAVLDNELKRAVQLSSRDRALTTELVYGTLRLRTLLEKMLEAVTPRGIQALDMRTKNILLVGAYQIAYTRIPDFAAVSEAVEAARSAGGRAMGGFANGALRQLARTVLATPPPPLPIAYRDATAPWLRRALERSIGEDATNALLVAGPYPPPTDLRVRGARPGEASGERLRAEWMERLRAAAPSATIEAGRFAPGAIHVRGGGDPHALPGYADGGWTIQEEGSQLVGFLLGVRPGDIVLDACAGRGNKSGLLAETLLDPNAKAREPGSPSTTGALLGRVDVADARPEKLSRLANEFRRLGLEAPKTFGIDWSVGTGDVPLDAYDRVLVDAPCSGTGTIRRRPEIQTRRQAADLPDLTKTQTSILANASRSVRPGGRIVYAVCSALRDEAEAVIGAAMELAKDLEPAPFDAPIADLLFTPGATQGRLLTNLHGTDAYFVASFRRRG